MYFDFKGCKGGPNNKDNPSRFKCSPLPTTLPLSRTHSTPAEPSPITVPSTRHFAIKGLHETMYVYNDSK